jgi:hypothetical protein
MITLNLASPFWEDPASLSVDGEDEDAVLMIVAAALDAAGYEIEVRQDPHGETIPWAEYEPEARDA